MCDVGLKLRAPFAERRDGGIEYSRRVRDVALRRELDEVLAIYRVNCACLVAIENHPARNETRAHAAFDRFENSKQPVDGTTGSARRRLIDSDGKKSVVAPIAPDGERRPVCLPLREKFIDGVQQLR